MDNEAFLHPRYSRGGRTAYALSEFLAGSKPPFDAETNQTRRIVTFRYFSQFYGSDYFQTGDS